ncbi:MAG: lamin tail domain-containing protein, partial [Saprospiraceae bacterium]
MTFPSKYTYSRSYCMAVILLMLFPILAQAQTIYINEFMASNSNTIADANGDFDDWVELYNPGNSPIDISGYFVSDDLGNQNKRQLPNDPSVLTIPANGYLLLWFDAEPLEGADHVDLKLGASGEDIVLVSNDGTT